MQARKLMRLLKELIEEDPARAYYEVCVDTRYSKGSDLTFKTVNDFEIRTVDVWNEKESPREVIVVGNY